MGKDIKFIAVVIVCVSIWRSIIFLPNLSNSIYYIVFGAVLTTSLIKLKVEVNKTMLLFILLCGISLLINDVPEYFRSFERLISFLLVSSLIGPLFCNSHLTRVRNAVFKYVNNLIVVITIISFIGFLARLSSFYGSSGFQGITNQSMMLGPISAFSGIICIQRYFTTQNQTKNKRIMQISLILISVLVCLIAGSRGALASLFLGAMICIFLVYRNSLIRFIRILIIVSLGIVVSYPLWMPYTERIQQKQENAENKGSIYASREDLWDDRINEFESSPYFGVGFSSMNPSISQSHFDKNTGNIEPGSSWLFLLSSLGIFATCIFFLLIFKPLIMLFRDKNPSPNKLLVGSILSFFVLHLLFEGYVTASGSFLFVYLWLCIGVGHVRASI